MNRVNEKMKQITEIKQIAFKNKNNDPFPGLPLHFVDDINKLDDKKVTNESLSSIILSRNSSLKSDPLKKEKKKRSSLNLSPIKVEIKSRSSNLNLLDLEKENGMTILNSLIHKDINFIFIENDQYACWGDSLYIYGLKFQKKQHFYLFKNCITKIVGELKNPGIFYQINEVGQKLIMGCSLSQLTNLLISTPSNQLFGKSFSKKKKKKNVILFLNPFL